MQGNNISIKLLNKTKVRRKKIKNENKTKEKRRSPKPKPKEMIETQKKKKERNENKDRRCKSTLSEEIRAVPRWIAHSNRIASLSALME